MPFWRLYYHLVWATKNREAIIDSTLEHRLYPYLTEEANSLGCRVDAINGFEDHIHIVISIPPKFANAEIVQRLKGSSSHDFKELSWQSGYGIFSCGEKQRQFAIKYVKDQKEHHRQKTTNGWLERCDDEDE